MADEKTTYVIETKYLLDEKLAASALDKIGDHAEKAGHHVEGLSHSLHTLATAVGLHFLAHEGVKAFVDFNSELEQMKISMSAIIEMNLGGSFKKAQGMSEELFKEFQRFSKLTPVTTKEVMSFGTGVSAAVFGAGGSMKDFIKITEQGVIASKVFGANAEYAALEIQELLMGNVNKRMRFAMQLLHAGGVEESQFKAMTAKQRMGVVEKVLGSDALKQASEAFSNSFAGVTSTFKDNIEIALGKVGLPLFRAITAEVQRWNDWIEKHPKEIAAFAEKFSNALKDGFEVVRSIGGFIVAHADLFLTLGKIWAANKLAGGLAGGIGGSFSALANGMTGLAKSFPSLISGIATLAVAVDGIIDAVGTHYQKDAERMIPLSIASDYAEQFKLNQKTWGTEDSNTKAYASRLLNAARDAGALSGPQGFEHLDSDKLRSALGGKDLQAKYEVAKMFGGNAEREAWDNLQKLNKTVQTTQIAFQMLGKEMHGAISVMAVFNQIQANIAKLTEEALGGTKKNLPPGDTNMIFQHVEVASDDPDRFLFTFEEIGRTARRNPAQARQQLRGFGG